MRQGRGRIAKAAAAMALLMVLALGALAPRVAWANVGDGTGTITITPSEDNGSSMAYRAYKIFKADVDQDGSYATDVDWASEAMASCVRNAINTYDNTQTTTNWDAAKCADYIVSMFSSTGSEAIIGANGFAMNLAKAVYNQAVAATFGSDTAQTLDEGYYLIVSVPASDTSSSKLSSKSANMGTSPIFTMLGEGQKLAITEKVSMPTITKTMIEDSTETARSYGDAQLGQEVSYTLTGTVSYSIDAFTKYKYTFVDQLPDGMDLKTKSDTFNASTDLQVQITVADGSSTKTYTVDPSSYTYTDETKYENHKLTVAFYDLRKATESCTTFYPNISNTETIPVDATAVVTVTYTACLNSSAALGASTGNTNSAYLVYGNDPMDPGTTGKGATVTATTYTYGLTLTKVDKKQELDDDSGTSTMLSGAKFTIQDANSGCYLKNDGTLGDTTLPGESEQTYASYLFTTDSNGAISIRGLDSGTYTISEVEAPSDYVPAADLKLTLSVTESSDGKPTAVSVELTGGENDGIDSNGDGTIDKGTRVSYDASTGVASIVATNKKGQLPLTGLSGITMVYVIGGAILLASLVVLIRRRIQERDE